MLRYPPVMPTTTTKQIGRAVRVSQGLDLCLECGGLYARDGASITCKCAARLDKALHGETGVMLGLWLPEPLARVVALPPGVDGQSSWERLHVTLAYLGRLDSIQPDTLDRLLTVVPQFAQRHTPMFATLGGYGEFPVDDDQRVTVYAPVDSPDLPDFRHALTTLLDDAAIPYSRDHGFQPHVTLGTFANGQVPQVDSLPELPFEFTHLTLAVGDQRIEWPFAGAVDPLAVLVKSTLGVDQSDIEGLRALADDGDQNATEVLLSVSIEQLLARTADNVDDGDTYELQMGVTKTATPERYTFGPLYVPDFIDAHGEYSTPEDLQKAVWEYVRSGDRRIRHQHQPDVVVGEWVELAVWPQPVEVDLSVPGSTAKSSKVTFPADTPFMGVIWDEDFWPRVSRGEIRGYSLGGKAKRLSVDVIAG